MNEKPKSPKTYRVSFLDVSDDGGKPVRHHIDVNAENAGKAKSLAFGAIDFGCTFGDWIMFFKPTAKRVWK